MRPFFGGSSRKQENGVVKRTFLSPPLELILWYREDDLTGFQLVYVRNDRDYALTWLPEKGLTHHDIDGGELKPGRHQTPILMPDGEVPIQWLREHFEARMESLPEEVSDFVRGKLGV